MVQLSPFYCHNGIPVRRCQAALVGLTSRLRVDSSSRGPCVVHGTQLLPAGLHAQPQTPCTALLHVRRCLACRTGPPAAWSASGSASR